MPAGMKGWVRMARTICHFPLERSVCFSFCSRNPTTRIAWGCVLLTVTSQCPNPEARVMEGVDNGKMPVCSR